MTQTEHVLALLRARGVEGLTPKAALALVGTMRLAARISDLRAAGHDIRTETLTTTNGARVARYVLVGGLVDQVADALRADATVSSLTEGRIFTQPRNVTWDTMREQVMNEKQREALKRWSK